MKLRPYQKDVLTQLNQVLKVKDEVVVASAPNSGKTLMAIEFMKQHASKTFLILTHGTVVLKEQWADKLKEANLPFSEVLGKERITYGLPQGMYRKTGFKVDYLIIDEAHAFTFAKMVKEIKSKCRPKKTIYLTGTPSKFIAKGYETIVVPALDLIKNDFSADLYLGMLSTSAIIEKDDFNQEGDVKDSKAKLLEATVGTDLDTLLTAIHSRLCETGMFKGRPNLRKKVEWAPTLGALKKTMIACRSVIQANKVEKYFKAMQIPTLLSHSENDLDSSNIQRFKTDPEHKVLVVVDRGILGFDMHDLVNVVDLTCSKNIDRTYQLYARVMRKSSDNPRKYFFKFSPESEMLIMRFYMNAALMLMTKDFISKYNGKNLNGMNIPVLAPRRARTGASSAPGKSKIAEVKRLNIDKFFMDTVQVGAMLIDIHNKIGQNTNEYAYTTFGEIKSKVFGKIVHDSESKKNKVVDLAKSGAPRPNSSTNILGRYLSDYTNASKATFDLQFTQTLAKLSPKWFDKSSDLSKKELLKLAEHGFSKPSQNSNDLDKKRMAQRLSSYISGSSKDIDFIEKLKLVRPEWLIPKNQYEAYLKVISLMPPNVKIKDGQIWKGVSKKYIFIDDKFGEFESTPSNLTNVSWPKGNTGHPKRGYLKTKLRSSRKVKNMDTKTLYSSCREAAKSIKKSDATISIAATSGSKAGGYNWAYCDDEGNVIETKAKKK